MRKTVLSLILALALCVSLGFLAFAEASEPGRSPDFEDNAADCQTVRSDGSHYTSKTFDRLYHAQVAEPTGNVYDYYISPTITAFCNDLRASEKWYTTLSITVETYLNGIEVSSGASALSLRNIRVEMDAGSEDVYFTGVVDTGISDGASYAPAGGVVEGEITSTLAVGFEDLELSADGACLESAARVSLYNEAEQQKTSVAFRWTYDIYVNNKYDSSRVLGTSLPIAVKPL